MTKGPHRGFEKQSENMQVRGPQIERIKGGVGGRLRCPSAYRLAMVAAAGNNDIGIS